MTHTTKERHSYPSDITREEFEFIRADLEGARKRTRPRTVDLYDVFCAVLYLLRSGCQWRIYAAVIMPTHVHSLMEPLHAIVMVKRFVLCFCILLLNFTFFYHENCPCYF